MVPATVGFFALFSPKRKSEKRESKEPVKNGTALLKNGTAPHHLASQGASPRGEAAKRLNIFAEENFASKILCRQGEATKWLTIFAEKK